jgi:hypothetical protein
MHTDSLAERAFYALYNTEPPRGPLDYVDPVHRSDEFWTGFEWLTTCPHVNAPGFSLRALVQLLRHRRPHVISALCSIGRYADFPHRYAMAQCLYGMWRELKKVSNNDSANKS